MSNLFDPFKRRTRPLKSRKALGSDTTFNTRSRPASDQAADFPTTHSPESVAASPCGDGSGRPASFSRIFGAPYAAHTFTRADDDAHMDAQGGMGSVSAPAFVVGDLGSDLDYQWPTKVFPSTRYEIEIEDNRRVSEFLRSVPPGEVR